MSWLRSSQYWSGQLFIGNSVQNKLEIAWLNNQKSRRIGIIVTSYAKNQLVFFLAAKLTEVSAVYIWTISFGTPPSQKSGSKMREKNSIYFAIDFPMKLKLCLLTRNRRKNPSFLFKPSTSVQSLHYKPSNLSTKIKKVFTLS